MSEQPDDAASPTPTDRRTSARRWVVLAVALVVQLVVLYAPTVPEVPGTGVPGSDKVVHAAVFAAVTVAAVRAGLSPWLVAGYGVAHAGVSEALQHVVLADRSGDGADALADVVGTLVGLLVARLLSRRGR